MIINSSPIICVCGVLRSEIQTVCKSAKKIAKNNRSLRIRDMDVLYMYEGVWFSSRLGVFSVYTE